ncbi:MAG: MobF family relaxase [Gemmataceae bacterium]
MVGVTALSSAAKASYYTATQAAGGPEGYYVQGQGGAWLGSGAEALGLSGPVEERALDLLFRGRSPADGSKLVQAQGKNRQAGWDVTVSDPKSLSALWAVADPALRRAINDLRAEAIRKAVIPYLEEICFTRRGKGGREQESAKPVVAAFFEATSRESQPQCHTHLVVANVGVRDDGTTGAILSKPFYRHQGAINALYMCEFGRLLEQRLGLRLGRDGQWFEVAGVPQKLCRHWSKRSEQIEQAVGGDRGLASAAAREVAALSTRDHKARNVSEAALLAAWQAEGKAHGFTRQHAERLLGQSVVRDQAKEVALALERALEKLNQTHSHFGRADVLRAAWTEAIARGLPARAVRQSVERMLGESPEIVRLGSHRGEERYATREMMRLEEKLLSAVDALRADARHGLREETVESVLKKHAKASESFLKQQAGLTDEERRAVIAEQRRAVRVALAVNSGVAVITGLPGTGKTHTLKVIREAAEKEGYELLGAAVAGKAARGLEEGSGIKSRSVEALLRRLDATALDEAKHHIRQTARAALKKPTYKYERVQLTSKSILVIDEAGMVDTAKMLRLLDHVRRAGAKAILVGDPDQIQPIGPGAPLRHLAARVGEAACALTAITRQREQWQRDAILDILGGAAEKALAAYAVRGLLRVERDRSAAVQALVEQWKKDGGAEKPKDHLIIASQQKDVDRLNKMAQEARRAAGLLTGFRARIGPKHLYLGTPQVRLADGNRLYEGDRVLFTRNAGPGIVVPPKPIARVLTARRPREGVSNGDLGTVLKIDEVKKRLTVRFDDQKKPVTISYKYYQDLALGYALTTHKCQGVTCENALALVGGSMQDREVSFVQASRARGVTRFFTDRLEAGPNLEKLVGQFEKSRAKDLAHDVLAQARQQALVQQLHV